MMTGHDDRHDTSPSLSSLPSILFLPLFSWLCFTLFRSRREELLERLEDRAVLFASVGLHLGLVEARHALDGAGEPLEDLHGRDLRLVVHCAPRDHRIARERGARPSLLARS